MHTLAAICAIWEIGRSDAETLALLDYRLALGCWGGFRIAGSYRWHFEKCKRAWLCITWNLIWRTDKPKAERKKKEWRSPHGTSASLGASIGLYIVLLLEYFSTHLLVVKGKLAIPLEFILSTEMSTV